MFFSPSKHGPVLLTGWMSKQRSYVKANCNVICIERIEKTLTIKITFMIKGQITLTFLEIFLNNTSKPSNFIQFHFNNLPNTQFNFSHIGLIYLVSVFSFGNKLNEVFFSQWRNNNNCFYQQIESNIDN